MDVDRLEHNEWDKHAAEKDITWWRGDTFQGSWGDNHDVSGDVNLCPHKVNSKGHYFAKGKTKTFSSQGKRVGGTELSTIERSIPGDRGVRRECAMWIPTAPRHHQIKGGSSDCASMFFFF